MKFDSIINKPLAIDLLRRLEAIDLDLPQAREQAIATIAWVLAYAAVSATEDNDTAAKVLDYAATYAKDNAPLIRKYLAESTTIN